MPQQAGAELRAQGGRPRAVQEARGKVVDDLSAAPRAIAPTLALVVDPAGRVSLFGIRLSDAQLLEIFRAAAARDLMTHVVVTAPPGLEPRHKSALLALVAKTNLAKVDFVDAN